MGRTYRFEYAKCGCRAEVAGGAERGFQLAVQTIQCLACRELIDAITELKVPATSAANVARWKLGPNQRRCRHRPRHAANLCGGAESPGARR